MRSVKDKEQIQTLRQVLLKEGCGARATRVVLYTILLFRLFLCKGRKHKNFRLPKMIRHQKRTIVRPLFGDESGIVTYARMIRRINPAFSLDPSLIGGGKFYMIPVDISPQHARFLGVFWLKFSILRPDKPHRNAGLPWLIVNELFRVWHRRGYAVEKLHEHLRTGLDNKPFRGRLRRLKRRRKRRSQRDAVLRRTIKRPRHIRWWRIRRRLRFRKMYEIMKEIKEKEIMSKHYVDYLREKSTFGRSRVTAKRPMIPTKARPRRRGYRSRGVYGFGSYRDKEYPVARDPHGGRGHDFMAPRFKKGDSKFMAMNIEYNRRYAKRKRQAWFKKYGRKK